MSKVSKAPKAKSAIDAIKQPFQFESKSTQTHSPSHDVRLGGKAYTVSVRNKHTGEWESVTRYAGGEVKSVSYRIRTGKTKRERLANVREAKPVETKELKKKKK